MNALLRKVFLILIGLTAGAAAWGVMEILMMNGTGLGRHILLSALQGAVLGLFFGFFFGSAEGIILSDRLRALRGGLSGALLGLAGGIVAVVLAQGLLYAAGNAELFAASVTDRYIIPLIRSLGWVFLGLVIGSIDGVRSGSGRRIGIGMSGGALGGLLGGLMLEFLTRLWNNGFLARGTGIVILGVSMGLFYSLFEYSRAFAIIRVLTGKLRGKEYVLNMRRTKIGSAAKAHIPLMEYAGVSEQHAVLTAGRDSVIIRDAGGGILVNDQPVGEKELKYEDVIQIGSAKLFFLPR